MSTRKMARIPSFLAQPSRLLPLGVAVLLGACAAPATQVVLLPQADGKPSAVVVRNKAGEQVLSQPYQRATTTRRESQAPSVDQANPEQVRKENTPLFELLPLKPQTFTLYFDVGGTVLTTESQQLLPELLGAAAARPGADIVVIGHTDTRGAGQQNDGLSLRRAEEVRQMLLQRGFPADRIEAAGRGERDLAVTTADEVDEPRNRRVTVEVR